MNKKSIQTTILAVLSIQSLLASSAQAFATNKNQFESNASKLRTQVQNDPNALAERIIQKHIVGFDPKQAITTLTYLKESGIKRFQKDGAVVVNQEMLPDIFAAADVDGLEVRIVGTTTDEVKIKLAAHDHENYDRSKAADAKSLASYFQLKCDMDGKTM